MKAKCKQFIELMSILLFLAMTASVAQSAQDSEREFIWGGLAWSPDGQTIAVATNIGINLHHSSDLSIEDQLTAFPSVSSLDWSPNSDILVSGYSGGEVLLWQKDTRWTETLIGRHDQQVGWVKISPDSRFIASSGLGTIKIYDVQQRREQFNISDPDYTFYVRPIQWTADGNYLMVDLPKVKTLSLYGLNSGQIERSMEEELSVFSFQESPNSRIIAVIVPRLTPPIGGHGSIVQLWDAATGKALATYDSNGTFANAIAWSPDSALLAVQTTSASDIRTGQIGVWNVSSNTIVATLRGVIMTGDAYYNNAIAWSPQGDRLASISDDGRVIIWDSKTFDVQAVYDKYKSIVLSN